MSKKILFVENSSLNQDNPMSTCYALKCTKIKNDSRFHYYDISGNEKIDCGLYDTVVFGCRSIYLYKRYIGRTKKRILKINTDLCQIKNKYFIIQDMHKKTYGSIERLCQFLGGHSINIIFTFYRNTEASFIRKMAPSVKHFYLPHHIDTSIFRYLGAPKIYDILLFGSIHPTHYPFRKRLFELVLQNKNLFSVHFIEKPEVFDPNICEDGLAKLINQSKICIATKSKYDYLVGKYFEISACKTLVAGNIPTDGTDIFKNNVLELTESMGDDEIIKRIQETIKNYSEYSEKIEYLHNYVTKNCGLDQYVDKLYAIID